MIELANNEEGNRDTETSVRRSTSGNIHGEQGGVSNREEKKSVPQHTLANTEERTVNVLKTTQKMSSGCL